MEILNVEVTGEPPGPEEIDEFLSSALSGGVEVYPSVGLGVDLRIDTESVTGPFKWRPIVTLFITVLHPIVNPKTYAIQ